MTRALRVSFWLIPIVLCFELYRLGIRTWFSQDDFAWLGLRLEVRDFKTFLAAMFEPKAQGTIRPWSERGFFMLFSYLFGMHALPYRIFVFCNQCLNLILLMRVTLKLTRSQIAGFIAPLLWIANIALITPMAWTSAYNEIQCATFLLLSFYLFLLYTETGRRGYYWVQWLTFVLGFGALEINFVYPVLACLYAILFARSYIRGTLPMLAASAVYVAVDRLAGARAGTQESNFYYDLSFKPQSIINTLVQYWTDILGIVAYGNLRQWPYWVGTDSVVLLTVLVAGFVLWQTWKRNFLPLFFTCWFFIVLGPLLPLHNHLTDYYLVVPTLGVAMLAAYGIAVAWRRWWSGIAATAGVIALYFLPSVRLVQVGMRSYYERGESARILVESVAYAKKVHPNNVILLNNVDDGLFWAAVYDSPFRIFGWNDVLVTAESRPNIHETPHLGSIDHYFLPPRTTLSLLKHSAAVVYAVEGDHLRNITRSYLLLVQSRPPPPLDPFVDLGVPFYMDQLGPGWYGQEIGYRWAAPHAVVYLPGPALSIQQLHVHGYVTADMVKERPLHLAVTIDGRPEPMQTITPSNTDFTFTYNIPAEFIGSAKMEVAFNIDRPTRIPGDSRILGVAFGTFAIR
jgi:hypothetical protein